MTISSDVLKKLMSQDWDDLLPRLVFYARREIQQRGWSTGNVHPEEIANAAVDRVLTGRRRWEPARDPDILGYLCNVVDSLIGHLPSQGRWILSLRDMHDPTSAGPAGFGHDGDPRHDPETAVLRRELEAASEGLFWTIYESMAKDPPVQQILDCIHEGIGKREDIVKRLGIAPHEFDNARRRLRDRLKKTHPQMATGQGKRR